MLQHYPSMYAAIFYCGYLHYYSPAVIVTCRPFTEKKSLCNKVRAPYTHTHTHTHTHHVSYSIFNLASEKNHRVYIIPMDGKVKYYFLEVMNIILCLYQTPCLLCYSESQIKVPVWFP